MRWILYQRTTMNTTKIKTIIDVYGFLHQMSNKFLSIRRKKAEKAFFTEIYDLTTLQSQWQLEYTDRTELSTYYITNAKIFIRNQKKNITEVRKTSSGKLLYAIPVYGKFYSAYVLGFHPDFPNKLVKYSLLSNSLEWQMDYIRGGSSTTSDKNFLYLSYKDPWNLVCYSLKDGKKEWVIDLKQMPAPNKIGFQEGAIFHHKMFIIPQNADRIIALNYDNGDLLWRHGEIENHWLNSRFVFEDNIIYIFGKNKVKTIHPEKGKVIKVQPIKHLPNDLDMEHFKVIMCNKYVWTYHFFTTQIAIIDKDTWSFIDYFRLYPKDKTGRRGRAVSF